MSHSRLLIIFLAAFAVSGLFLNGIDALRLSTKLQYKQAFTDGFWRGLAGKNAIVTYYPVNHGGYTYYQPYAKYYAPGYGYRSHGHGQGRGQGHGAGAGFGLGLGHGQSHYGAPAVGHGQSHYGAPAVGHVQSHYGAPAVGHGRYNSGFNQGYSAVGYGNHYG